MAKEIKLPKEVDVKEFKEALKSGIRIRIKADEAGDDGLSLGITAYRKDGEGISECMVTFLLLDAVATIEKVKLGDLISALNDLHDKEQDTEAFHDFLMDAIEEAKEKGLIPKDTKIGVLPIPKDVDDDDDDDTDEDAEDSTDEELPPIPPALQEFLERIVKRD